MMERFLVECCAPTLAGLKAASLFSCPAASALELDLHISNANSHLNRKDVFVDVLRSSGGRALILVYRKNRLIRELQDKKVSDFLARYGYDCSSVACCIAHLKERFVRSDVFPHEIGIFLGYPLEDVMGFIANAGKNSKHSGPWKVYGDECKAAKLFKRYDKCREIYTKLFAEGRKSILQLTVAV